MIETIVNISYLYSIPFTVHKICIDKGYEEQLSVLPFTLDNSGKFQNYYLPLNQFVNVSDNIFLELYSCLAFIGIILVRWF